GGDNDPSKPFNVSYLRASRPASPTANTTYYVDFDRFAKTGISTWILTGTTNSVTPWTIEEGTLSVSRDGNLGAAPTAASPNLGTLTFTGGTLENTAAFSTARKVRLKPGGGTFGTDADLTVSGQISGHGGLFKTGSA